MVMTDPGLEFNANQIPNMSGSVPNEFGEYETLEEAPGDFAANQELHTEDPFGAGPDKGYEAHDPFGAPPQQGEFESSDVFGASEPAEQFIPMASVVDEEDLER
jgi:hypothetical protein